MTLNRGYSRAAVRLAPATPEGKGHLMDNGWQKKWDGRWDQFKGQVKQAWGDMTDDDCDVAEGEYDEMVGRIKTRTGEQEQAIRDRLSTL